MYTTPTIFKVYSDPGHGWLIVSREVIAELGLSASDFSSASFASFTRVALEEDCDAMIFLHHWKKKHGSSPRFDVKHTDREAICRQWPSYGTASHEALMKTMEKIAREKASS